MTKYIDTTVGNQLPEFVRNDNPVFVDFLRSYYKFLDQYNVQYERTRDVDSTTSSLVSALRQEFLNKFPTASIDDRKLIKLISQLYKAKGTLDSIELLFRIFFNEAITIYQPNKSILRASDGRWEQESAITLETVYGTIPDGDIELKVENQFGVFFIEVDRIELVGIEQTRFFFKKFKTVPFEPEQNVDILDANNNILFRGKLVKTPARLVVTSPGLAWKVGQVIIVPGSDVPTIARVTAVSSTGQIQKTQIVEYGYEHPENQITVVSPYPNRPAIATSSLDIQITAYDPLTDTYTYDYTLTLDDYTEGTSEEITAFSDNDLVNNYFLENYVERGYTGYVVLYQLSTTSTSSQVSGVDPDLTIEQWLASRAFLRYEFDYVIDYTGGYVGSEGQISNPYIRLQDNYFYQLFSYVIETNINIKQYNNVLGMVHPAGLKFFGDLIKSAVINLDDITAERTLSRDTVYRDDVVQNISDSNIKSVTKESIDQITTSEEFVEKLINSIVSPDSVSATDNGVSIETLPYMAEDYFAEYYTITDATITIG